MTGGVLMRITRWWRRGTDEGAALLTAVLFLAVTGTLAAAVAVLALNAQQNASRDRQAGAALATAEAGVAQAVQLLRTTPAGYFTCLEPASGQAPAGACLTNPAGWTSSTSPQRVSANGTVGSCDPALACYAVWVGTVQRYSPAAGSAVYRIHSTGLYGGGPAARSVAVDVKVAPAKFPIGIYTDSASTGGSFGISRESMFSIGCIVQRRADTYTGSPPVPDTTSGGGGVAFAGIDAQYGIPAAAHAVQYVTQANSGCSGGSSRTKQQANVHDPRWFGVCNTGMPDYYDQDGQGGDLTGTPCANLWTNPQTGKTYPSTSKFTMADLQGYGYRPGGLSPSEYAALKSLARSTGTYFTSPTTSGLATALAGAGTNAVAYWDLQGGTLTLSPNDIPSRFFRPVTDASPCPLDSLVVVVRNGNLVYNTSGAPSTSSGLVTSMFVPEGSYKGQGNATIIGTLFAQSIASASGTQSWNLDDCFVNNPPAPVTSVRVLSYREVDTQNVN